MKDFKKFDLNEKTETTASDSTMEKTQDYVLGFMFSNEVGYWGDCALIRKMRPEWQAGLLNGIGGKIEGIESPTSAMVREFEEETGYKQEQWKQFLIMNGKGWRVFCFVSKGPLTKLKTMTDEEIEIRRIEDADGEFLENVQMLMASAYFAIHTEDHVSIEMIYTAPTKD